ncbi:hypothetical protein QNI19_36340 [Cytophagaceae bacterium DM2B3-1]|uniref:Uncharacterized protein n=1 Tax=Xanthocytophaga flava TaxID=3048013 RepID=A0ABT7CXJ2_9BACT|nr:hypothetical protein [Xanthocytophaga flavus]MDJ1466752.1 hypothetical protein [Xanthocytophaga flavus]MDJ1498462.1 hypothetical protein [Xanthocytophaga flavus]
MYFLLIRAEMSEYSFIFVAFPSLALFLGHLLSLKKQIVILLFTLLLFAPKVFGYNYIVDWLDELFLTVVFACVYSIITYLTTEKPPGCLLPAFITIILAGGLMINVIKGSQTVEQEWEVNNYQIEYIQDQGFTGGSLMKYKLEKYAFFHILKKELEIYVDPNPSNKKCQIVFKESRILFDKCQIKVISRNSNL